MIAAAAAAAAAAVVVATAVVVARQLVVGATTTIAVGKDSGALGGAEGGRRSPGDGEAPAGVGTRAAKWLRKRRMMRRFCRR